VSELDDLIAHDARRVAPTLIFACPRTAAAKVRPAVGRPITEVMGEVSSTPLTAFKAAIGEAQQKMAMASG
jgi:hypothetical protein